MSQATSSCDVWKDRVGGVEALNSF